MKKQTNKLFLTILIIFTFFLLLIFSWFNYQNYIKEKSSIENNLLRLSEDITKEKNIDNKPPNNDIVRRIYMDYNAYTIILNNNNISNIINSIILLIRLFNNLLVVLVLSIMVI